MHGHLYVKLQQNIYLCPSMPLFPSCLLNPLWPGYQNTSKFIFQIVQQYGNRFVSSIFRLLKKFLIPALLRY